MNIQLKQLVIEEATKLKQHATKEELNNLNFETFHPNTPHRCIYGQMAEECRSDRSLELLNKCTVPYSTSLDKYNDEVERDFKGRYSGFSPIEFYICRWNAKNKTLIDFLKGERETLTVNDL